MRASLWLALAPLAAGPLLLFSCGSRTGLDSPALGEQPEEDASHEADAPREADRTVPPPDALPPLDSQPNPDVIRTDCPDAAMTLVYVIGDDNELYSFDPPTLTFTPIGRIACPSSSGPYSMAVDRKGRAYIIFQDGALFQVSTATASCSGTAYTPGQLGFNTFGMGFVSDNGGPAETLYVAEGSPGGSGPSKGVGAIDVTTFQLRFVGPFSPPESRVEFTGTGDGRLFGFSPNDTGSQILEVDKTSGKILAADPVAAGSSSDAFAFAFWGGDFWIFTGVSTTGVYRYRPSDKTTTFMTNAPSLIVGAGVSTCAPQ